LGEEALTGFVRSLKEKRGFGYIWRVQILRGSRRLGRGKGGFLGANGVKNGGAIFFGVGSFFSPAFERETQVGGQLFY